VLRLLDLEDGACLNRRRGLRPSLNLKYGPSLHPNPSLFPLRLLLPKPGTSPLRPQLDLSISLLRLRPKLHPHLSRMPRCRLHRTAGRFPRMLQQTGEGTHRTEVRALVVSRLSWAMHIRTVSHMTYNPSPFNYSCLT
jgi:hypothetical protein